MNEAGPKTKQQVIDKIKSSTNILVTVSKDPSVDALSAAIGLTTILNKLNKHGTAIFSGEIPPAINFLEPNKVFENTADSLRDFIIALDKEKADHLRYKVDGDVVKIFITPYRTTITSDDLEFSQGDYNIELVIALGVDNQDHLDAALTAHGQVLHDVSIVTFSAGKQSSQLGSMDLRDSGASSLSEMVANFSELLKVDKPILDKQISTALLTGIVAATDRFSNLLTTSRVMTTAAQLMAAGADQQLIAARLQESHEIDKLDKIPAVQKPKRPTVVNKPAEPVVEEEDIIPTSTLPVGSLVIEHDAQAASVEKKLDNAVSEPAVDTLPKDLLKEAPVVPQVQAQPKPQEAMAEQPQPEPQPQPNINLENAPLFIEVPEKIVTPPEFIRETPKIEALVAPQAVSEPMLGGAFGATTNQALEDKQQDLKNDQNKTILTHSYLDGNVNTVVDANPINGIGQPEPNSVDIFSDNSTGSPDSNLGSNGFSAVSSPNNSFAIGSEHSIQPITQPPVPDLPLPPQLPDFSTLPPIGPAVAGYSAPVQQQAPQAPASNDPGQFRIPGQQ
ncbi:hypothetical protein CVV43_02680 [Candidatus Saccharibacteria bacterium HGW-Saccharibacteria-1]|jgi:hypothetical protein|nr:MAG: hypothetical protein CVV43_02680 [Candidatus Saccharibacteria bacterium HGW-Saccharibacteria-1]